MSITSQRTRPRAKKPTKNALIESKRSEAGDGFQFPAYRDRGHLFELLADPITGPRLWTEAACTCVDIRGAGKVPFQANNIQADYDTEVWAPGITADVVPKPRKQGFSYWRCALGSHALQYGRDGRTFRIVAHREKTIKYLNGLMQQIYRSAWNFFREMEREDPQYRPSYFMRPIKSDTMMGYTLAGDSMAVLETASGSGVGQADRTDDAYLTEATKYEDFDVVFDGIQGSMPDDAETRFTIDFNAVDGWIGTPVYPFLKNALLPKDSPDWNGFHVFFRGIGAEPELYTPARMARIEQRYKAIDPTGGRFRAIYPRVITDLYQQRALCVHKMAEVEACRDLTGGQYLAEFADVRGLPMVHAVDTATGLADGDWQICSSFALYENVVWELCPP
ncbi:MAG: hypothetical protein ACREJC_03465, partial [Tepidisphaeraceae bacterium]